jgi:putative phage repressor
MKTIEETRRAKLKTLIEEYGSQAALARQIDKAPAQISQWINGTPSPTGKPRSLKAETAREIERKTGKPAGWFDQPESKTENQTGSPALRQNCHEDEEIVTLIHKNIFVGCGGGAVNDDFPEIIRRLDVPRKNLALLFPGLDVENLTLVGIKGDSMEPTLPKRGLAFVDERIRHFDGDGIYAFFYDDDCGEGSSYMKRLQKVPGRLIAHSDNPKYSAFDIKPDDPFQIAAKFVAVLPLEIVLL